MDIRSLIPFGKKNVAVKHENEHPFTALQREMNRMFDSFNSAWRNDGFPEFYGSFTPRMNVSEDTKAFIVTAELPGMNEKDIDLSVAGDTLTIKGEKKEEKEEKGRNYYRSERSYGAFTRSIPLPQEVEADRIAASFKKGVLTITLPKTASVIGRLKKIPVNTE